jgi:hypothetical protein
MSIVTAQLSGGSDLLPQKVDSGSTKAANDTGGTLQKWDYLSSKVPIQQARTYEILAGVQNIVLIVLPQSYPKRYIKILKSTYRYKMHTHLQSEFPLED